MAAQPRLSEDTSHLAIQPDIYVEDQKWAEINKGHFKEYSTDAGSIIVVPKHGLMAIDTLKKYISDKQQFFSERDFEKGTLSISPLLGNHINSHLVVGITIGVILKLRF